MRRGLLLAGALALVALAWLPPRLAPGPDPALLPPRGRALAVPGGELNVVERGAGTPVVLVHGLPGNVGDWASLPERLAARGHRVVTYDRLGFGHASRPEPEPGRYTLASNTRELGALLDALALPRAALVGWSYGGGIAQVFAREHAERVSHVVLLSSVGPLPTRPVLLDRLVGLPFAVGLFEWIGSVPPVIGALVRDGMAEAFSGAEAVPPGWLERSEAMLALPHTLRSLVLEMQRYDAAELRPEEIRAPVLVLHGDADRNTPLAIGEDLARRIPGARLETIPGGSHMLQATHSERLAESIHGFLADAPG